MNTKTIVFAMVAIAMLVAATACALDGERGQAPEESQELTVTPMSSAAATVPEGDSPGPEQLHFVDGRFRVKFTYRADPELAAQIDVVDVDLLMESSLERIHSLLPEPDEILPGRTITIMFQGPVTAGYAGVGEELEQHGFYAHSDLLGITNQLLVRFNPNGPIKMDDLWAEVVPGVLANGLYHAFRQIEVTAASHVNNVVTAGLARQFEEEAFPGLEARLRTHLPDLAAVNFDLSGDVEEKAWSLARTTSDLVVFTVYQTDRYGASLSEMYPTESGAFPADVGASVGRQVVLSYMENNPDATPSLLVYMPVPDILEGSRFEASVDDQLPPSGPASTYS